jgi:formate dehydrogenase subunit delta
MSPDKLVTMANQIATFFKAQGEGKAPEAIAGHIQAFWDPRMRREILAIARGNSGARLDPLAVRALELLNVSAG